MQTVKLYAKAMISKLTSFSGITKRWPNVKGKEMYIC